MFTGRRDDIPAVTAAFDVAVLPSYREAQGLTILEAMALSRPGRRVQRGRDPRDDPGRRHGAARAAARPAGARRRDRAAAAATTSWPTRSAARATTWSTTGSASQLMVKAVQELYDEGARAIRPREVTSAVGG